MPRSASLLVAAVLLTSAPWPSFGQDPTPGPPVDPRVGETAAYRVLQIQLNRALCAQLKCPVIAATERAVEGRAPRTEIPEEEEIQRAYEGLHAEMANAFRTRRPADPDSVPSREPRRDSVATAQLRRVPGVRVVSVTSAPASRAAVASGESMITSFFAAPTVLLEGLSGFLIQRARDELTLSFLHTVRKYFDDSDESTRVPRALFPATRAVILQADEMSYRSLLSTVRAAIIQDLRALPENLEPVQSSAKNEKSKAAAFRSIAQRFHEIESGKHPLLSLSELSEGEPGQFRGSEEVGTALRLTGLVARETHRAGTITIPLGSETKPVYVTQSLEDLLAHSESRSLWLAALMEELGAQGGSGHWERAALRVFGEIQELADLVESTDSLPAEERAVAQRRYLRAISAVVGASLPTDSTQAQILDDALDLATELQEAIALGAFDRVVAVLFQILSPEQIDTRLSRFLGFASSLAMAEEPDDVQAVLETVADPVGSFRARRGSPEDETNFNVAIVSYLGLMGGREDVLELSPEENETGAFGGLAAPVGVEFSLGSESVGFVKSFGVFLAPIDPGTFVSYRLSGTDLLDPSDENSTSSTDDEDKTRQLDASPEIGVSQVFAPSFFLTFGITDDNPITVGLGAQFVPDLRGPEEEEDIEERTFDTWRFGGFLSADLTLFRF